MWEDGQGYVGPDSSADLVRSEDDLRRHLVALVNELGEVLKVAPGDPERSKRIVDLERLCRIHERLHSGVREKLAEDAAEESPDVVGTLLDFMLQEEEDDEASDAIQEAHEGPVGSTTLPGRRGEHMS